MDLDVLYMDWAIFMRVNFIMAKSMALVDLSIMMATLILLELSKPENISMEKKLIKMEEFTKGNGKMEK